LTISQRQNAPRALGPAAVWRVLRGRNFAPYFLGNAASASGTWFQTLAASILLFRLTHSAFLLGVLQFCQFVPVLVLAAWAGALADRVDRRLLLLATQVIAAAFGAGLAAAAWTGHADETVVIGFSAGTGVALAFSQPAQMALVPSLVPRADVAQAVALNSVTFNLARAIGPVTAAAVVHWGGFGVAFTVNAASYAALIVGLLLVRPAPQVFAPAPRLRDGLRLVRADRRLALYLLAVAAASFGADPINTESPALAHAFGYSSNWAGTIVGAFGAGAVLAAAFLGGRIAGSRLQMAATLGLLALGNALCALSPWLPLACGVLAFAGFGYLASNASATARLQLGVDESQRGRIMALWSIAFLGTRPISSLLDGALASTIGVKAAAAAMGVPALAGALAAARRR
jgi:MFS family permease